MLALVARNLAETLLEKEFFAHTTRKTGRKIA
jgi:hypothetical protein